MVLLSLVAAAATGSVTAVERSVASEPGATPVNTTWLSDRLVELSVASPGLDPPFPRTTVRVLLPAGHTTSTRRYPVVLLLHGIGDSARAWTTNSDGWPVSLEAFTEDKDVIVVMPDAGQNATAGWYSDWYNNGAFGPPAWETYHLVQLLELVDRTFPTRTDRGGRVVAGLSMGGFGAMSYAARHPDLFAGAFSFSGALDTRLLGAAFDERIWGNRVLHEARHRGHNPVDLADNLADTRVWFRTGMGVAGGPAPKDPESLGLEALLWSTNESFAAALAAAGVDHHYEAYPHGGHNWYHWQAGFQRAWPEIQALFDRPVAAPPASFRYRSIEPRFRIWGWDVAVDRPTTEFVYLRDVTAGGLSLEGSGTVTLATAPAYRPGQRYDVTVTGGAAPVQPSTVLAGADGRLRLQVAFGPVLRLPVPVPFVLGGLTTTPPATRVAQVRISPSGVGTALP